MISAPVQMVALCQSCYGPLSTRRGERPGKRALRRHCGRCCARRGPGSSTAQRVAALRAFLEAQRGVPVSAHVAIRKAGWPVSASVDDVLKSITLRPDWTDLTEEDDGRIWLLGYGDE